MCKVRLLDLSSSPFHGYRAKLNPHWFQSVVMVAKVLQTSVHVQAAKSPVNGAHFYSQATIPAAVTRHTQKHTPTMAI